MPRAAVVPRGAVPRAAVPRGDTVPPRRLCGLGAVCPGGHAERGTVCGHAALP